MDPRQIDKAVEKSHPAVRIISPRSSADGTGPEFDANEAIHRYVKSLVVTAAIGEFFQQQGLAR